MISDRVFENVDYDVLTIGNHELYLASVAYETFSNFSTFYGDRYVTSNVQIINPVTGQFQYIGQRFRYFTTNHGLRIMAFGVLFDFTGNTNVTKVIKAADLVNESWFKSAVNFSQPIDLFLVIGHNPVRPNAPTSTFGTLYKAIRSMRPGVPIQAFGGHSHVRDFVVYDEMSTGLGSGRYCETLGFLSLSGIQSRNFNGNTNPRGVPNPTRRAIPLTGATATATARTGFPLSTANASDSNMVYARRYLDWNRLTFAYHAVGSQDGTFDFHSGIRVTNNITALRKELNLTVLYGCAPETYCLSCKPYGTDLNIYSGLLPRVLSATVINSTRANVPRLIILNSGSIRFDLIQGPFTYDDSFIVSPFKNGFQYIPNVPYATANQVLGQLNRASENDKRDLTYPVFNFASLAGDACPDASLGIMSSEGILKSRSFTRGLHRRQSLSPGYSTTDDFGTDGDDTPHSSIPGYPQPVYIQSNGTFPTNGSAPATVDLIFLDFIAPEVLRVLTSLGAGYTMADVIYYLDPSVFTTQTYLPLYATKFWQANVPNCPAGQGITR